MRNDKNGDAYRLLLARLQRRARRLVGHPETAADLAQEAALRLWCRQSVGVPLDCPTSYAMTVLRNLVASHWRAGPGPEVFDDDMASTPPDALRRLALADVQTALDRLPATQARVMALVAAGITSPADIARITGQPVGTVMSRLARARASLRRDLGMAKTAPSATLYGSAGDG